jgi:hypothetical protein
MKRKLRTVLTLPRADMAVLWKAWICLLWVNALLRILPLPRIQERLRSISARRRTAKIPLSPERLAQLVATASRHHPLPIRCLQRSLVLEFLLGEHGHPAELRIGVRRLTGSLEAHAWVEISGQPLAEPHAIGEHFFTLTSAVR